MQYKLTRRIVAEGKNIMKNINNSFKALVVFLIVALIISVSFNVANYLKQEATAKVAEVAKASYSTDWKAKEKVYEEALQEYETSRKAYFEALLVAKPGEKLPDYDAYEKSLHKMIQSKLKFELALWNDPESVLKKDICYGSNEVYHAFLKVYYSLTEEEKKCAERMHVAIASAYDRAWVEYLIANDMLRELGMDK